MSGAEILIQLPQDIYDGLLRHLLRDVHANEEAAFVFVRPSPDAPHVLDFVDWYPVPPEGFAVQLPYHFELTDEARAGMIKRAHELSASVVEFHSHTGNWPAQFSPSDWSGFEEIVPHMWWRLKGRPYAAVVVSHRDFDGFAWRVDAHTPERLTGILVGDQALSANGRSPLEKDHYDWSL